METAMRKIVRHLASALSVTCFAASLAALSGSDALAQARQEAPAKQAPTAPAAPPQQQEQLQIKQITLTEKQVESVLTATKEMDPITAKLPEDAKLEPKITAQLEAVAKKNGFAGYDEYNNVVDNIALVLGGFDPQSKKYVGPEAVIKSQIAQVQTDKKMSAKDKKGAVDDLNEALKSPPAAIENKGNIDVVAKYYDKLADAFGGDDQE
jgi:hypothetical protein